MLRQRLVEVRPGSCYMVSGEIFQPDCDIKVTNKLSSLPACNNPGISSMKALSPTASSVAADKFIALGYNMKEGVITLLGAALDYGSVPNYFNEHGRFKVRELSFFGEELLNVLLPVRRNSASAVMRILSRA